ncbi:hypothetical protein [Lacipirellula sp.]|uniref:hypothetical protein n=1 Tax=Lacipirellula sp. TaxID=2691419 RepID=UPI003D09E206
MRFATPVPLAALFCSVALLAPSISWADEPAVEKPVAEESTAAEKSEAASVDEPQVDKAAVEKLVEQLDAADKAARDAAEQQLIELGTQAGVAAASEAFVNLLPQPNDEMPQEVQVRLTRIANEIRLRTAQRAIEGTTLTLDLADVPLGDALKEIEKQTGNRLVDYRDEFGQPDTEKKVTYRGEKEPFWKAVDTILDSVQMSPYSDAGGESLAIIDRDQGVLRRGGGRAVYSGPFRIEPTGASSQRGIRNPDQSGLSIDLEISWEPRLRPIGLSMRSEDLKAVCDDGRPTPVVSGDIVFDVEVQAESRATDVVASLQLPARTSQKLATVEGRMTALVPGRLAELRFDNLATAKDVTKRAGEVAVTIERVVKNQALWEVYMQLKVEGNDAGLTVDGGWVFQNTAKLVDKKGQSLDNAGFETTMQTEDEIGFAFFYELPEGRELKDYDWVYRTPASVVSVPVDFKLENVPLP